MYLIYVYVANECDELDPLRLLLSFFRFISPHRCFFPLRLVEVAPSFARIFKGGPQREKSDLPARP